MKTPKEYSDNLKSNIITRDMLIDCLFSVNKRAKNCRDKEQEYREFYRYMPYVRDKYHSVASYREKKNEYYDLLVMQYNLFGTKNILSNILAIKNAKPNPSPHSRMAIPTQKAAAIIKNRVFVSSIVPK